MVVSITAMSCHNCGFQFVHCTWSHQKKKAGATQCDGLFGGEIAFWRQCVADSEFAGMQELAWGSWQRSSDSCCLCCSAVIHQACAVRSPPLIPSVADMAPMKATKTMKAMKAAKAMTKGGIVSELASATDMKKSEVSQLLGQLSEIGAKEVKATGKFVIPGLCMIKTRTKPATKAGKRMMFGKEVAIKAQPAKTVVKAFAVSALKKQI
ncbi:unnamed protein product [Effrenium voratum]|nr:unnamed protein product [Effrenium voratum]